MAKKLSISELQEQLAFIPEEEWTKLGRFGITKDRLVEMDLKGDQKEHICSNFARGIYSPVLPLFTSFKDSITLEGAKASVRVYKDSKNNWKQDYQFPVPYPEMDIPLSIGRTFIEGEAKKNLIETGHCGMPVNIKFGANEYPCLISLNPYTNVPVHVMQSFAKAQFIDRKTRQETNMLYGAKLTDRQKQDIIDGKVVHVDGMQFNGNTFSRDVQFSAFSRNIQFVQSRKQEESQTQTQAQSQVQEQAEEESQTQTQTVRSRRSRSV